MSISRTKVFDYLYSSVDPNTIPGLSDNIFNSHVVWAWLSANNRVKWITGGTHIEERLMYGKNVTVTSLAKGGQISLTPPDAVTKSHWSWKYVAANMTRYWQDEHQASGPDAMASLVEDTYLITSESLAEDMNLQVLSDGTGNGGQDLDGLENIIAEDPTASSTVGGINQSTDAWWRNQYYDMSSDTFSVDGRTRMVTMFNDCTVGKDSPDAMFTSQALHELYEAEIANIQEVVPTESARNKIADLGFETLWFKRRPIFFDKDMTDVTRIYFINTRALRIVADKNEWLKTTPWKTIPNQPDDQVAQLKIVCNLVTNNRRKLGVLFNASG